MGGEELSKRESYLRVVQGKGTGLVPCRLGVNGWVWDQSPEFFQKLQAECTHVCIEQTRNPEYEKAHLGRDVWGCLWNYPGRYLAGQAVEYPLADWSAFKSYQPPDPAKYRDWQVDARNASQARSRGDLVQGGIAHGFLYLQLTYLRGFENFMLDLAENRKELYELRDMVVDFWLEVTGHWLEVGIDLFKGGDDLGHQNALPISPAAWRQFFKPSYEKIFQLCRKAGVDVYLHSDGWMLDIIPDLLETGVTILNPQDLVNGLDNLKRLLFGRACIDLDIDRQSLTVFGSPRQIDEHILRCVQTLGSPSGRLMLVYGAYPGTPLENIAQVARSMQKYHDYWVGRA